MKPDRLLQKFMRSREFVQIPQNEKIIALRDYAWQKENFKPFQSAKQSH